MSKHAGEGSDYKAVEKLNNSFKNKIKCLEDNVACQEKKWHDKTNINKKEKTVNDDGDHSTKSVWWNWQLSLEIFSDKALNLYEKYFSF